MKSEMTQEALKNVVLANVYEWSRKELNSSNVKPVSKWVKDFLYNHWERVPKFHSIEVYGDDKKHLLTEDFSINFAAKLEREKITLFILFDIMGHSLLVNTEGYNYCRYTRLFY